MLTYKGVLDYILPLYMYKYCSDGTVAIILRNLK